MIVYKYFVDLLYFFVKFLQIKINYVIILKNLYFKLIYMSQATVNKDDDLIILSDEVTSNDDFNFDFLSNTSEEKTTDVIEFNSQVETKVDSSNDFNFDFTFDTNSDIAFDSTSLDSTAKSEVKEDILIEQPNDLSSITFEDTKATVDLFETPVVSDELSFDVAPEVLPLVSESEIVEETKAEIVENSNTALLWDRNDILNETIFRLEKRKEVISWVKWSKQDNVALLKEKIAELKSQVTLLEWEIKELEKEEVWIDVDISTIEKMKSVALDTVTERPRKHNLDNIKKTK